MSLSSDVSADSSFILAENENNLDLGDEYQDFHKERYSRNNSKGATNPQKESRNILVSTLLFLPNRVLDFIDIFRIDIGVGPALGGVLRITPYGQAGVRFIMPVSLRVGLRGRRSPVFIEHTNELGVGPMFLSSEDRKPSPLECGLGADFIIAGAYAGISIDSVADFFLGFVGYDLSEDDL